MKRRELALITFAIGFVLAVPLLVPMLRVLFLKPLWLDELHTWLLARDLPGPALVSRLSQGADFNPPLLYVIDSVMLHLFPFAPPQMVLRATSVIAIWIAAVLLYRIARERLGVLSSAAGAGVVLAHPAIVSQLHEARFYAPWFMLTVAMAIAIQRLIEEPRSRSRFAWLALLTAATCLIHYFGIISVVCLALGAAIAFPTWARMRSPVIAMATGTLALVAWLPVYVAQRHVLSAPTWIPPATLGSSLRYVVGLIGWPLSSAVMLAALLFVVVRRRREHELFPELSPAHAALLGLAALPIALVLFSYAVQPVLMTRYALPAVAGVACLVALATAQLPRAAQLLVVVAMLISHAVLILGQVRVAYGFTAGVNDSVAAANLVAGDERAIVSLDRFALYPVALAPANRNTHLRYLILTTDEIGALTRGRSDSARVANYVVVERDAAIAHNKVFGFPVLSSLDSIRRAPSFFVLQPDREIAPPFVSLLTDFRSCRVQAHLLLFFASAEARDTAATMAGSALCERSAEARAKSR